VDQYFIKYEILASVQHHDVKKYYSNLRKHEIIRFMSK